VCNDGNVCTDDACAPATGCVFTNNTAPCSDGNACTTSDTCAAGVCVGGAPPVCDDANVCTTDTCAPATGCVFTNNTAACDDGNACTTSDTCSAGACVGGAPPVCDDGNVCTDDACAPATGCVTTENTLACDDADACTTGDRCAGGRCEGGAPLVCNDGNLCTDDACEPARGCIATPNESPCEDGNACTDGDRCVEGSCAAGGPRVCNDGDVCTDDACDPVAGCVTTPNESPCNDGNPCTIGDTCSSGTCSGSLQLPADVGPTLRLAKSLGSVSLSWARPTGATLHDVLRGRADELPVGPGRGDLAETCLVDGTEFTSTADPTNPASGSVLWYLVRGASACGNGTWGFRATNGVAVEERSSLVCP
jgi:hypothetical protein